MMTSAIRTGTSCAAPSPHLPLPSAAPMRSRCCPSAPPRHSRRVRPAYRPQYADDPCRGVESPPRRRCRRRVGAIEYLTGQLCEKAWGCFRRSSAPAARPRRSKPDRSRRRWPRSGWSAKPMSRAGRRRLIGTSDFPDLAEEPAAVLGAFRRPREARRSANEKLPAIGSPSPSSACATGASLYRKKHGGRPKVLLAYLGRACRLQCARRVSPRACSKRAASRRSVEGNGGEISARQFKESGAKLACLCSSDKVYERRGRSRRQSADGFRREVASILPASLASCQAALEEAGIGGIPLSRL